jgi:putative PIG3 family NAD(P)H quinone oxidoreductase
MAAVEIAEPGPPDVLRMVERPTPVPESGEVLIHVRAAGVNRPDILQRLGKYPPPPGASDLPGLEVAGTVIALGHDTPRWKNGDRVCALVAGGGYAEYCTAPGAQCLPLPERLTAEQGAAVPETFFTVWTNLFQRAALQAGERVLIHGGTSGIGTTAIQLARAFGAETFTTAGTDQKCAACESLGARAINYRRVDFVEAIRDFTSGRGVDVILDIVGGDYVQRNIDSLAMHGRLVQIGLLGSARAQINLAPLMQRRLTLTGSTLRTRSVMEKGAIRRELEEKVLPLLAAGTVAPVLDRILPLERAADAHRALEAGEVIGKVVLITSRDANTDTVITR